MALPAEDRLRVGRDPNDSAWITVRYPHDWQAATLDRLVHDPVRGVVELAGLPWAPPDAEELPACRWLRPLPAVAADGVEYRADPYTNRILRRSPCETEGRPLDCVGGGGWQTGRLHCPLGLAIDGRGFLYVADSGNHRVQILRPEDGAIIMVLGRVDGWGRPIPGDQPGAMREPVDVAVDAGSGLVFIADRGAGAIHVYDARFRFRRRFVPRPAGAAGHAPMPVAVASDGEGGLWVADARWPRLLRFDRDGVPLGEAAPGALAPARFADLGIDARLARRGIATIGPLDGRIHDQVWHRVLVEADLPPGTSIEVQTFASNDSTAAVDSMPWAPPAPVAIPSSGDPAGRDAARLVLSDAGRWHRFRGGPYRRVRPQIAAWAGDGPVGVDQIRVPAASLPWLRAGDRIQLDAPGATEPAEIAALPDVTVSSSAGGEPRRYDAGAELRLRERDGREVQGAPLLLHRLAGTEVIELSAIPVDGTLVDVPWPHACAALLRAGDVVELAQDGDTTEISVDVAHFADGMITLSALVGGDFSTGSARLVDTPERLLVEAPDGLGPVPPAEPIEVSGGAGSELAAVGFVELLEAGGLHAIWLRGGLPGPLVGFDNWERATTAPPTATDRGRYLWIRVVLVGAVAHPSDRQSVASPSLRSLRALLPRLSYLRYLPATYGRRDDDHDPSGALFLERFLAMFEGRLTGIEEVYESVSRMLNPAAAPPDWLRFLAAWLDIVFDPSWPIERRRTLVMEAAELYRRRGTPEGLRRYIEIYTGVRPELLEGYQLRPRSAAVVGGAGGVLGCSVLGGEFIAGEGAGPDLIGDYAHRFTLYAFLDDPCRYEVAAPALRAIVDAVKPAHTEFDLCVVLPDARVGLQSTVGVDLVLGDDQARPHALGHGIDPVTGRTQPVLGLDVIT